MNSHGSDTLVLFDFDGTLCKIDSFTGFMRYVFSKPHFYQNCLKISPFILAYYSKLYSAQQMRQKIYHCFFQNLDVKTIQKSALQYSTVLLNQHLNPQMLNRLHYHQQQQHHIVIVSASLNLYLQPIADQLKVDVICSQVDTFYHKLTGYYQTKDCSGEEKVKRLKQKYDVSQYQHIYAYGNSHEDFALLDLATHAFWVNRQQQLQNFHKKTKYRRLSFKIL